MSIWLNEKKMFRRGLVLGGRKGIENWDNPKNLTFLDRTRPHNIFMRLPYL